MVLGRLINRLLLLLCCGAPENSRVEWLNAAPPSSLPGHGNAECSAARLPAFRGDEFDGLVGECLELLFMDGVPPSFCHLALLQYAVPWALRDSRCARLHAALCSLLCALPCEALVPLLTELDVFLSVRRLQHALLPCYEMVLREASDVHAETLHVSEVDFLFPLRSPEPYAVDLEGHLRPAKRSRCTGGDGKLGTGVRSLRLRLCRRALKLQIPAELSNFADGLSMLGLISCLLIRTMGPSAQAATMAPAQALSDGEVEHLDKLFAPDGPDCPEDRDGQVKSLLLQVLKWLSHVVQIASTSPAELGKVSISSLEGNGLESSLLHVALDVSFNLVSSLSGEGTAQSAHVLELFHVMCRLAGLPWAPPPGAELQGAEWSSQFTATDRCDALRLIALLPANVSHHSRANVLHAAIEGCVWGRVEVDVAAGVSRVLCIALGDEA